MKSFSRRTFLYSAAASGALTFLSGCGSDTSNDLVPSANPGGFVQPPVLTGGNSPVLPASLDTRFAQNVVAGRTILTRTYEGRIGGPTIRTRPGQVLRIRLTNEFPVDARFPRKPDENTPHEFNSTNIHTHGLHVSPQGNSDNIFLEIEPQTSFLYEFSIPDNHPAGTFFYHPHKHGSAAIQMFSGMAGALIVEGDLDAVPEVAAARDLVYLINELNIDPATGQVPDFTGNVFIRANRTLTVNGEFQPKLIAVSGEVFRLRVINATVQTHVPFAIEGHSLGILALDGITLPTMQSSNEANLATASRADLLVRAGAPGIYAIKKLVDNGGLMPDPEEVLGTLEVVAGNIPSMGLPTILPSPASLPTITDAELNRPSRTLTFETFTGPNPPLPGGEIFTIDQRLFDSNRVDQAVDMNAVEEWLILNRSDEMHPFHLHTNPFQVIEMNGMALPRPEWHDTMHVPKQVAGAPGSLRLRVRFRDFTGRTVLHCHNVRHEDTGMMQIVEIS